MSTKEKINDLDRLLNLLDHGVHISSMMKFNRTSHVDTNAMNTEKRDDSLFM